MSKGKQLLSLKDKLMYLFKLEENLPKLIDIKSIPTQTIREYYVQPNLVKIDKDDNEKHPIELKDIFSQEANHKVLLEGGFGVGKTVILQRISHGWSEDEVIKNRYDSIYKLKLKLLLSDWQKKYDTDELDSNKLAYFIHYSINKLVAKIQTYSEYKPEYRITIHEIIDDINNGDRGRILLLLDGDNDLNALLKDDEINALIYEMIDFSNLIMTSRSNSLPTVFINEFDNIVEVTGFSPNLARQYINKYFFYQSKMIEGKVEEFFLVTRSGKDLKKELLENLSRATRKDSEKYEVFLQLKKIDSFLPGGLGSNKEEIQLSIFSYYQESQELLNKLLEEANVKELLENPMVTSMVCLVFGDPESRVELIKDLTMGKLYEEFMIWLSKKYFSSAGVDVEDITRDMIVHSKEIKALKEIAFNGIQSSNLIDGGFISEVARANGLDIKQLYNLGLLKVAIYHESAERDSLVSHQHSFARLTVQDYLSALFLKEKLMSEDEAIFRETAEFIAEHRNEKQYLVILKFMAEIITKDPLVSQECITRFWEAVTCNIDGVLELGMHIKVTLLMHLMTSAKINGEIDSRIPNKEKIISFIDRVVLEDLLKWEKAIKASGYLSTAIREAIWNKWFELDSRIETPLDLEIDTKKDSFYQKYYLSESQSKHINKMSDINKLVNIIVSAIDYLDNKILLDNIEIKLVNDDYQIKEVAIKMVYQLAKRSKKEFSYTRVEELIEKIIKYITDNKLKEHAIDALASLVEISDNHERLVLKILDKSFPFLKDKTFCDGVVKLIIKVIIASEKKTMTNSDLICAMNSSCEANMKESLLEGLKKIYQDIFSTIKYDSIDRPLSFERDVSDPFSLEQSNNNLILEMSSTAEKYILGAKKKDYYPSIQDTLDNISRVILGVVNNGFLEILNPALDYFISDLEDLSHQEKAAYIICRIAQKGINTSNLVLDKLTIILAEDSELNQILLLIINNILNSQKAKIDTAIAYSLIEVLKSFLATKDTIDKDLFDQVISAIGNVASLVEKVFPEKITELLNHLTRYDDGNTKIYRAISQIAEVGEESALETAFGLLISASHHYGLDLDTSLEISSALSKITKALNNEKIEPIWIARLVEEMNQGENNKAIFVVPIANILAKGKISEEYINYIANIFVQLLVDNGNPMTNKMVESICSCAKGGNKIKEVFFKKLFIELTKLTPENEINSRLVETISKLGYGIKGNKDLFDILISEQISHNIDTNTLAHSIGNVIEGSEDLSQQALLKMYSLLEHEDKHIVQKALYTIGKIVKKNVLESLMLEEILQKIIPFLEDSSLKDKALYVISKISAKEEVVLENFERLLIKLLEIPGNTKSIDAQNSALFAIGEIACKKIIPPKMKEDILSVLSSSINHAATKFVALEALSKIIKVMRLEESAVLLDNSNSEVRGLAAEVLSKKMEKPQTWDFKVVQILNILSRKNYENESEVKKLHELARKMLEIQISELEEGNLRWINEKFSMLLDISKLEFEAMALKLYDLALSDLVISRVETAFVIKCIKQFGFTNVIYSPKANQDGKIEFKILFNNKKYIFLGEKNLEHLERIASALISSDDMLAEQYRDNIPLFPNSGAGIKVAASDVKICNSIVSGEELITNSCQSSLLFLSDHHQSSPKSVFLLLERRVLGYYVVDKVYFKNQKIQIFHKIIYPKDIDSFRELIFTKMEYVNSKITYYGKTWWLDSKAVTDLIGKILGENSISNSDSEEEILHLEEVKCDDTIIDDICNLETDIPRDFLLLNPIIMTVIALKDSPVSDTSGLDYMDLLHLLEGMVNELSGDWVEDSKKLGLLSKKQLLKKSDSSERIRIEDHDLIQDSHARIIKNEEEIQEIKEKLKNIDIGVLESLIDKEKLSIKDSNEIASIESNPYQYAFYKAMIWQLNSVYIACSAINSQMVENIDTGAVGKIGSFLKFISSHTPLVGMGVSIIGQIFDGVESFQQQIKVNNYFHIAKNSEEMSRLAELIARKLVLANVRFSSQKKISDVLDAVTDALGAVSQISISGIVTQACQNFKERIDIIEEQKEAENHPKDMLDYVARFALASQHDVTPERAGERDSELVTKIIVENIFSGKYQDRVNGNTQLIDLIIQDILSQAVEPISTETAKKEECCCSCIVMRVEIDKFNNPILNHKSFLDICKAAVALDKEHGVDNLLRLGNDKPSYEKLLNYLNKEENFREALYKAFTRDAFNKFLEVQKLFFGEKEIALLSELGEDENIASQIMNASKERGLSDVLDDLFSRSKFIVEKGEGGIEESKVIEYIEKYRKIIGEEGFKDSPELYKYEDAVIFKNKYPSVFTKLVKKVVDLASNIENLLDKEAWYEFLGIDTRNEVAINWLQLNGLLELMTSIGGKLPISRPPFYDPGDDFGGGYSGGGNSGDGGPSRGGENNTGANSFWIPVSIFETNSTDYILLGSFGGSNTSYSDSSM